VITVVRRRSWFWWVLEWFGFSKPRRGGAIVDVYVDGQRLIGPRDRRRLP